MKKQLILGLVLMGSVPLFGDDKVFIGVVYDPKACQAQCSGLGFLIGEQGHGVYYDFCFCSAPTAKK